MKPMEYEKFIKDKVPKPKTLRNCFRAFWVGGAICTVGEVINTLLKHTNVHKIEYPIYSATILVFIGSLLTGLGIYDRLGKYAGAGSIVPITGFANSIVSPAMEFKREGFVFGVGAKMFSVAGPVLVYGISTSIIVGVLYQIFGR